MTMGSCANMSLFSSCKMVLVVFEALKGVCNWIEWVGAMFEESCVTEIRRLAIFLLMLRFWPFQQTKYLVGVLDCFKISADFDFVHCGDLGFFIILLQVLHNEVCGGQRKQKIHCPVMADMYLYMAMRYIQLLETTKSMNQYYLSPCNIFWP